MPVQIFNFLLLAEQKSQTDSDNLKEAIFNHNLRNDERLIFRKIYNDIDLNLENESKCVNAGEKFPEFAGLKFPLSGKKIY